MINEPGKTLRARKKSQKRALHGSLRTHNQRPMNDVADTMTQNEVLMDELDGDIKTNEVLRGMSSHHLSDKRQIK